MDSDQINMINMTNNLIVKQFVCVKKKHFFLAHNEQKSRKPKMTLVSVNQFKIFILTRFKIKHNYINNINFSSVDRTLGLTNPDPWNSPIKQQSTH